MLDGMRVIDADGHVNDWHIDWTSYLPDDLVPFAPKSISDERGFPRLEVDGRALPERESLDFDYSDIEAVMAQFTRDGRYWLPRPGESHAAKRMPDMDEMGIDVSVLFGGHSFLAASMSQRPETGLAACIAYNSYLAEYCAFAPDQLKGVAMLPLQMPEHAAAELERCVKEQGFVAGVVPPHHADGTMLDDPRLDVLWSAAQSLGVPICVHTIGVQINPLNDFLPDYRMGKVYGSMPSMLALGSLIFGKVLERYPELRFAFLEVGAGWVPYVAERIQGAYEIFSMKSQKLARDPAETIRSGQLYFAVEPEEAILPAVVEMVGEDHLVLGSDYCHPEGMCPYTMKALAERKDLPDRVKAKILDENPARLFAL